MAASARHPRTAPEDTATPRTREERKAASPATLTSRHQEKACPRVYCTRKAAISNLCQHVRGRMAGTLAPEKPPQEDRAQDTAPSAAQPLRRGTENPFC